MFNVVFFSYKLGTFSKAEQNYNLVSSFLTEINRNLHLNADLIMNS